jgi:hypothetical protein
MGMQNVRAILPEQIDNLINTSTRDTIDEVVRSNVGTTSDRIITDNAKLANINALRTLYKVKTISVSDDKKVSSYKNDPYIFHSDKIGEGALYYVDFSVKYKITENGSTSETRWFPIRIIDDAYLADVLNDWVLAPRMRTPAMVVYAKSSTVDNNTDDSTFELYVGENDGNGIASVAAKANIEKIRCSYIKKPNEVRYLSDIGGTNVNSDLPEQLQIPMLKHAVDLYRASIQGSLFAAQQQNQEQQRETARNNVRPDNEGYQS